MKDLFKFTLLTVLGGAVGACTHQVVKSSNLNNPQEIQRSPDADGVPTPEFVEDSPRSQSRYFDWPVDQARMTRGFLPNRRKPHLGIDLAAPRGTDVFASHDGVVIYAGREFRGYGKMVMIEGRNGWATLYAHFSKILVKEGQVVQQGDLIGDMGSTGRSTGSHVHFEIRRLKGPVDPMLYLPRPTKVASNS